MNEQPKNIHLEKTLKAFSYNVLGVILPFILSLLGILLVQKYEAIWKFLDEGQFFLFGAGLYTTSILFFSENRDSISKKKDKILSNLSFWLLIICSAFYAIIYSLNLVQSGVFKLNITFIRFSSIFLFVVSVISVYRGIFVDFLKIYPEVDVKRKSKEGIDDIMNKL